MRIRGRSVVAVAAALGFTIAGSADAREDDGDDDPRPTEVAIRPGLPPPLTDGRAVHSITVGNCTFTVGTAITGGPARPPQTVAWIWRGSAGGPCRGATGYRVLGASYAQPDVALAGDARGIVAGYTAKRSPSGSGAIDATFVTLDFDSLVPRHTTTLSAHGASVPAGYVALESVALSDTGTLTAVGTSQGRFHGETGRGPRYRATYDAWLSRAADSPSAIVRY